MKWVVKCGLAAWLCGCGATAKPRVSEPVALASRGNAVATRALPEKVAMTQRVERAPVIDGRLDEPQWQEAPVNSGFFQREPHEGAPPELKTEFRVVYDDDSVYVAVRAHDPDPESIVRRLTRRDEASASDWIYVGFDSYDDERTAFVFGLNAAGVQRDLLMYDDVHEDPSWNAVWEGAARVDGEGWVAEFRIPLSQLRYASAPHQKWGIQVTRSVQRTNEQTTWAPRPLDSSQNVSLFGELVGLDNLEQARRFEILPYGVLGASLQQTEAADPLNDDGELVANAGLDFKYGLGSNVTLSGAINPDFGQVEADPSQVNLSANEIFFAEKRPFFLEGSDIFSFKLSTNDGPAAPQLFYSRRIGAAPHESADGAGAFFDEPAATTILGAAKLSGKTAGGWSFGVLEALTAEERARFVPAPGDDPQDLVIEPLTNYSLLRLSRDFNGGRTKVGVIATGVHRALGDTGIDDLRQQAYAGGAQMHHRFGDSGYEAEAGLIGSHVRGDAAAIDATQRGPQRYFQRPDADHLDYDPTRTSLSGMGAYGAVGKWSEGHWRYGSGVDTMSPGFEVNDMGFQTEADFLRHWVWGQYWDGDPGKVVRNWQVNSDAWTDWNYGARWMGRGLETNAGALFSNYWSAYVGAGVSDVLWSARDLRGGPLLRRDTVLNAWGGGSSDSRRTLTANLGWNGFLAPANGSWGVNLSPSIDWHVRSNLALSAGPSFGFLANDNQYVTEVADPGGEPHYIMARLEQVTTAMTLRTSYTISPTLSLQLYAQPFVSTGAYSDIKQVSDPRAADYDDRYHIFGAAEIDEAGGVITMDTDGDGMLDASIDRPDFSFAQMRSTLVGRWEYHPGSTLFLIWSHNRTATDTEGRFSFDDDYGSLADEQGEHIVMLKLNYWLGG